MSYSFVARGATTALALADVAAKLDEVAKQQPEHQVDRDRALKAATDFAQILPDSREGCEVVIGVHGSIGWEDGKNFQRTFLHADVGISAGFQPLAAETPQERARDAAVETSPDDAQRDETGE